MSSRAGSARRLLQKEVGAIEHEFNTLGSSKDKQNLREILAGTYLDDAGHCRSLDELMAHPHAKMAKLERQHVLALRLYTSSSYAVVNAPLRKAPPQRPHPFAATTYLIDQGIKLLRAVAAPCPTPTRCASTGAA